MPELRIVPITLARAKEFVKEHHRHNKPPTGHKFSIGICDGGELVGVATAGRPIARMLDDGLTMEVNRTCTSGTPNANSMLYGAVWRAAKAMGYRRCITYIQESETGASLRAAGWVKVKDLPARPSWAQSSVKLRGKKDPVGNGGVARQMWEIRIQQPAKMSPAEIRGALAFSPDTAAPGTASHIPPSSGHCAVVALIVWTLLGGDLVSATVEGISHWFNRVDGMDIDLTADQFGQEDVRTGTAGDIYPATRVRGLSEVMPETIRRAQLLAARSGLQIPNW